ncbi:MAG: excinuclease ABC subunit UvrA [Ignavibacteriaceae bacterium]
MAKKVSNHKIVIKGARQHNLKNVSLELPRNKLIVFTGVSGSGKSSLVFDTIYAEGQRRYVESLSSYARQFLERINKPDVDLILGISPAIAIEQKTVTKNSRSTVGTTTEVYDYLRLLFARIGKTYCFHCNKVVTKATTTTVADFLETQDDDSKFYLTFPLHEHGGKSMKQELELIKKRGFFRITADGKVYDLNEGIPSLSSKSKIRVILERFKTKKGENREALGESIEITFKEGESRLILINADSFEEFEFNKYYECCGIRYEEPEPKFFSFNNPFGACPVCQGFSKVNGLDMNLIVPNPNLSIIEGAIAPWRSLKYAEYNRELIRSAAKYKIPVQIPFKNLSEEEIKLIKEGTKEFRGIDKFFGHLEKKNYKMTIRILLSRYKGYTTCNACKGTRLRREALQVKVGGRNIHEIVSMSIRDCLEFFKSLMLSDYELKISERVVTEIIKRLTYLNDVGLSYLTPDRLSQTLSGGETQRINLATALGSSLVGTLYILDEPSIGLHPRDNEKLISILKNLRDIGNSVLVVEHEPEMIKNADVIIDMGPGAGNAGGDIVFQGSYEELLTDKKSLTGEYLSGRKNIEVPKVRRVPGDGFITIKGAHQNNLKNIDVKIPLKNFVVVTGVSGSGKSTLVHDILYGGITKLKGMNPYFVGKYDDIIGSEQIEQIEIVNQSPIGKSPRSNPISFIGGYEIIRDIFAATYKAKSRGFKAGYFSFNIPGGRCDTCQGDGFIKVEMQFLADIYLECEECKGTRFKKEIREITYQGLNVVDVLRLTVDEAIKFFTGHDKLVRLLTTLQMVGMGYIKLGQPSNTLSGGEAQRVKLASHIATQKDKYHTLFIFDEPSTGLHFDDVSKLINCFNILLSRNNSIVIIEHNLDIIKCADYIIDLGPEAGDKGGDVVATGTPEEIAANPDSHTGKYLLPLLSVS